MILKKYLDKIEFDSYKEFKADFKIKIPENFNFAYDVVDEIAVSNPDKIAMVWCDDKGNEAIFTFGQMKYYSDKAANFFKSQGIHKGDPVMLILKRHFEFWFCTIALNKIGAITIPATHLLSTKDIIYRNNAADIKMIVCLPDPEVIRHIEESESKSPTLKLKVMIGQERQGWLNFTKGMENSPENFIRPSSAEATSNNDIMLLYFTSGTTGMPKMVNHDFVYPLGHILTAKYWQNVQDNGLHFTVADTGWAKSAWGKLYGQWLSGSAVMTYDYDKFVPRNLMEVIEKYKVTTFCAPPTIYRFLIKEDLTKYDLSHLKYCVVAGEPLNPEVFKQFDDQLTASVWKNGVYRTGDMAWCDEDGYFWFVGRADDVIKSSGYRIGPFEVESALMEHPAVLECAITAVPDPDRGQIVKATIVVSKNYHPSEELAKELQEHVKRVTAPYKYPRLVEFVTELPKTISGKIRRVQIRDEDKSE